MSPVAFTQEPFKPDAAPAVTISPFVVGDDYTRDEVGNIIGFPLSQRKGGVWATGYFRWKNEIIIWCNVGVAGRTGHDYPNRWARKELIWYGKTATTVEQPMIREMLEGRTPVHVFWRGKDRSPFAYAGLGRAVEYRATQPIEITWAFDDPKTGEMPPAGTHPRFRRGPPPIQGSQTVTKISGPASVYLMVLKGPVSEAFPSLGVGDEIIKVGMSNAPSRRLTEMNSGFPPGCELRWEVVQERKFSTADEAYSHEGSVLDRLRIGKLWIGGEFAKVPTALIGSMLQ